MVPERLNLAVGHRCFVHCPGCYQMFGYSPPDLAKLIDVAHTFQRMGVTKTTVSGGDPLSMPRLPEFLRALRKAGMRDIKVDTVAAPLVSDGASVSFAELLALADIVAVPIDGWSEESNSSFRPGPAGLLADILRVVTAAGSERRMWINTVVHRENALGIRRIFELLKPYPAITRWNLFQYMPTDQASARANERFTLSDCEFADATAFVNNESASFTIDRRSKRSRLGEYLLINSAGDAWLPDEHGCTLHLGSVYDNALTVTERWSDAVTAMAVRLESRSCFGSAA